jgi:hypothetical protein
MAQYKVIGGKRYYKSVSDLTKSGAERKAASYRNKGMLARAIQNSRGRYDVFTARPLARKGINWSSPDGESRQPLAVDTNNLVKGVLGYATVSKLVDIIK